MNHYQPLLLTITISSSIPEKTMMIVIIINSIPFTPNDYEPYHYNHYSIPQLFPTIAI